MESKPHLSARETRILLNYGMAFAALVMLLLFLGWVRAGFPTKAADPFHAQIAVLVPLSGESAENGKKLFDVVSATKKYVISERNLKKWDISVVAYNSGNTPTSVAWA